MNAVVVIKSPLGQPGPVAANPVSFGNNGYIFFSPDHYLYGRPSVLARTLREWADKIDPKSVKEIR